MGSFVSPFCLQVYCVSVYTVPEAALNKSYVKHHHIAKLPIWWWFLWHVVNGVPSTPVSAPIQLNKIKMKEIKLCCVVEQFFSPITGKKVLEETSCNSFLWRKKERHEQTNIGLCLEVEIIHKNDFFVLLKCSNSSCSRVSSLCIGFQ